MTKDVVSQIELPENPETLSYDDWLEFFRKIPVFKLLRNKKELGETLPADGFAAANRWVEIANNPSKMDKLYQGRLKAEQDENVMDLAIGDDDEAFYEALIKENVTQLNSGNVSPQEVARLSQNINIFRKELREIRSRKPKENTKLAEVLKKLNTSEKQGSKTAKKGGKTKDTIDKSSRSKNA